MCLFLAWSSIKHEIPINLACLLVMRYAFVGDFYKWGQTLFSWWSDFQYGFTSSFSSGSLNGWTIRNIHLNSSSLRVYCLGINSFSAQDYLSILLNDASIWSLRYSTRFKAFCGPLKLPPFLSIEALCSSGMRLSMRSYCGNCIKAKRSLWVKSKAPLLFCLASSYT